MSTSAHAAASALHARSSSDRMFVLATLTSRLTWPSSRGDWIPLRQVLRRYPHSADTQGTLRGRSKVMAMLAHATTAPAEPTSIELRGGQAYLEHVNCKPCARLAPPYQI